jgi:hypothetical protein
MNTISNNPTNASGADAAIPNFDAAVIGADIKAKVSEADRLENERKAAVKTAQQVYKEERARTAGEMVAASKARESAIAAATNRYVPLIREARKQASAIIVQALKSHPEQEAKIRKCSGLGASRWKELSQIAGGKRTMEEVKANSAGRQQDKRARDRAAAGKPPTEHDIKRANKAVTHVTAASLAKPAGTPAAETARPAANLAEPAKAPGITAKCVFETKAAVAEAVATATQGYELLLATADTLIARLAIVADVGKNEPEPIAAESPVEAPVEQAPAEQSICC